MNGLFARNFDSDDDCDAANASCLQQPNPKSLTLSEVERLVESTRLEAYQNGLRDGAEAAHGEERTCREARSVQSLERLVASLGELAVQDQQMRAQVELDVAELLFGVGERIFPELFGRFMPDMLLSRIHTTVRTMIGHGKVVFYIPEELSDILYPRIEDVIRKAPARDVGCSIVTDPQIADGTIRVEWQNGFLEFDPSIASLEVLETLKEAILEMRTQMERTEG